MRTLKFRIMYKCNKCGHLNYWFFELKKGVIEDGKFLSPCCHCSGDYKPYAHEEQFTGLLDKEGKEIFEGDIVIIEDEYTDSILDDGSGPSEPCNHLCPVIFKDGMFGVEIAKGANVFCEGFCSFGLIESEGGIMPSDIEIIGNIHEHIELLEGKQA